MCLLGYLAVKCSTGCFVVGFVVVAAVVGPVVVVAGSTAEIAGTFHNWEQLLTIEAFVESFVSNRKSSEGCKIVRIVVAD